MNAGDENNASPQFSTAEYGSTAAPSICTNCQQPVGAHYFRINDAMICPSCALAAKRQAPEDNHAAFVRAVLFGVGAAILGLVLYAGVTIITGWAIGYVSLAVGYIVGKGMMMGSNGLGGRRYQIVAVLLTYAAVSMAAVPIGISQISKYRKTQQQQMQQEQQQYEQESGQKMNPVKAPRMNVGAAVLQLAVLGLLSPFYDLMSPMHGLIGLVILFIGIRFAWQITAGKRVEVLGPFDNTALAS